MISTLNKTQNETEQLKTLAQTHYPALVENAKPHHFRASLNLLFMSVKMAAHYPKGSWEGILAFEAFQNNVQKITNMSTDPQFVTELLIRFKNSFADEIKQTQYEGFAEFFHSL